MIIAQIYIAPIHRTQGRFTQKHKRSTNKHIEKGDRDECLPGKQSEDRFWSVVVIGPQCVEERQQPGRSELSAVDRVVRIW